MGHLIATGDRYRARLAPERNFQKHRGCRMAPQLYPGFVSLMNLSGKRLLGPDTLRPPSRSKAMASSLALVA